MADRHDELDTLRAADPAATAPLPDAADPRARALFERIVMDTITPTPAADPADPADTDAPPRPRRARALLAAAAVVVTIAGIAGAVALSDDDPADRHEVVQQPADEMTPGGAAGISPGGGMAMCVATYDLTTLAERQLAFEGTVRAIDGDSVTFDVARWFRGGTGGSATLQGAGTIGTISSAADGTTLEPGTHLLVAGDDGIAWGCGFTQPYDDGVAAQWADVFAG